MGHVLVASCQYLHSIRYNREKASVAEYRIAQTEWAMCLLQAVAETRLITSLQLMLAMSLF